jgi:tetratricopeptide (TPR) repeat protein
MKTDPTTAAAALAAAQADLDDGRLQSALTAARALAAGDAPATVQIEALRLQAQSAFHLGEQGETVAAVQALFERLGGGGLAYPSRSALLAISAVACGELARFDESLAHLQQMLSVAARGGSFEGYVRARSTAATCFALLGDPWAGQRLLSELLGLFQGLPSEASLEAAVRNNHASICLRVVRLARDAGEAADVTEAIEHAQASLQRVREIVRLTGDARRGALADIYAAEMALLRGDAAGSASQLQRAIEHADATGQSAHVRFLKVLQAEAFIAAGAPEQALAQLREVAPSIREGHCLGLRIRCVQQLHRACAAVGAHEEALDHAARARSLEQHLLYRQLHAQSRFLRSRLELEHLYRYRANASRSISSRPGALDLTKGDES